MTSPSGPDPESREPAGPGEGTATAAGSRALDLGRLGRFFSVVERAGGRIPHPFLLFLYLLIVLAVASAVLSHLDATARVPGADGALPVRSVLSVAGVQHLLSTFVTNFIGYPPLGVVLAMLLGVGVAERAGFLNAVVSAVLARVPRGLMPYAVTYVAAQGHVMGDASMVILPPLAALAFRAVGRHPIAGMLGSFASTTVGYASGVLIGALDANLSAITASVAPHGFGITTSVVMNYFFQAVSGLVLPLLTGFLLVRWVEPSLPPYRPARDGDGAAAERTEHGGAASGGAPSHGAGPDRAGPDGAGPDRAGPGGAAPAGQAITAEQRRGLRCAVLALTAFLVLVLACWLIPSGPLRGPGGGLVQSPFFDGIVTLVMLAFLVCGIAYGVPAGTIRAAGDVPRLMAEALQGMLGYIVIAFTAGQFIAMFTWSHVGEFLAVQGAGVLRTAHLTGFPALLVAMAFSGLLSLVVFSGSSLWTVLAPVLVPVFAGLGYHPAVVQAAYRVGDSVTHPVSPLNPYVYMLELSARTYDRHFTLGMVFARLSLFVVPVAVLWVALFAVFYFAGIPFGPGVPTRLGH
ncbi:p-aminobenzoyl-glutamate transporter [Streptomyces sulfonofaciens]|uniref:p-aminobenzoyl-glutamate transporter n=1 Tax=Streptomyces sulfonofaciens TaxID=68272 RepID=A0A919KXP1_9ACTN|nr:AbgT family transporter [Streptomyces sulfonofaciens]GHH77095.1 p-aminobenzoyl-glutamate transporter [Streptomyces sulfonofaciens]